MSHLVGGISSAGRAVPDLDGERFMVSRSAGAHLWDQHGRRFIDTAMGFGATVLGHAPSAVTEAVRLAADGGPMPAFAHALEEEAAAALAAATGPLDKVIFVNSGSEAVHLACRVARAVTGRGRIAKFAAGYDGWFDEVAFGNAGSFEARMQANERPRTDRTTLLRYNDPVDVELMFAEDPDIAAVLLEPVLANAGCILPEPGYLEHVAKVARAHGALVIADEVLMGFRIRFGLASHGLGLDPDIATVGKAIGSGIAVAAVVGRADLMQHCEAGTIVRAGTYSGNPVACAAVCATLRELADQDYSALLNRGDHLRHAITDGFARQGQSVVSSGYGSVFTLWFAPQAPRSYEDALRKMNAPMTRRLHVALRGEAIMTMPSAFGRIYLSFAHKPGIVVDMISSFNILAKDARLEAPD